MIRLYDLLNLFQVRPAPEPLTPLLCYKNLHILDSLLDGVHHYDENGLKVMDDEPFEILNIHKEEIAFVKAWLEDWDAIHAKA